MSLKTMTRIWEHSAQTSSDLLLLLAIADHADDDGVCWPGIDKLAKKTRCLPRQVKRNIQKLAGRGELFIQQNRGRGHTNLYFILAGFDAAEIVNILQRRFEIDEASAKRFTQDISKMQNNYKKGVIQDTIKPQKNSVTGDTIKQKKGVIRGKKVSSGTVKGVTGDTRTVIEPSFKPSMKNNLDSSSLSCSEIWQQVEPILANRMTRATFLTIFPGTALARENGHYVVTTPSPAALDWLEHRLAGPVENAVSSVAGESVKVYFKLQERI